MYTFIYVDNGNITISYVNINNIVNYCILYKYFWIKKYTNKWMNEWMNK